MENVRIQGVYFGLKYSRKEQIQEVNQEGICQNQRILQERNFIGKFSRSQEKIHERKMTESSLFVLKCFQK